MKLPRDWSAQELIQRLSQVGYVVARQTGSHIRLSSTSGRPHQVTIPNHRPIKIGTLNAILQDIASTQGISKQQLLNKLLT